MNNQRDTSSYFVRKTEIKNKVKRRFEKIIQYEEFKKKIISEPYNNNESTQAKEMFNKYIEKLKNKAKKDAEIYTYG